jgi:hypothetical protein
MRGSVLLWLWIALAVIGCDYLAMEPGDLTGDGGATGNGSVDAEYVACAQNGDTVLCDYGPVVYECTESFYAFVDCAGG